MKVFSLEFNCFKCHAYLNMPDAIIHMNITAMRKFFKYMDQEYWRNTDSIKQFFSCIPEVSSDLYEAWGDASRTFQKEYQDPNFKDGVKIMDKVEREKRRCRNKRLMNHVKKAKAEYDRFEKRIPKLKELQEMYER